MKRLYEIIFGINLGIVLFLIIISVVVIVKKIREDLFNLTNILVLMPLEQITQQERRKVETFI